MAKTIETSIIIEEKPEKIWSIMMDFESYPKWNPFIKSIKSDGSLTKGSKLEVVLNGVKMKPKVLKNEKYEFTWLGSLLLPKIFDGEHIFMLEAMDGKTKFIHKENFRGILVQPLLKMIGKKTKKGFENMNEALKILAESS